MWVRLLAIVRKELLHILRDPRNLFLVTVAPAFLLLLLSNVFSFDATQVKMAVLDLDRSPTSRTFLSSLTNDGEVLATNTADSQAAIVSLLVAGQVDAGLVIPPGFGDKVASGQPAEVQALVDGSDPFSAGQATNELVSRAAVFSAGTGAIPTTIGFKTVTADFESWYNASLKSLYGMVPGLLAIVLIMPTMAFALALAREKESGTLEGLMATPVSGTEYLTGKLLAYVLAGLVSTLCAWLVAILYFHVPFRGSLAIYLLLSGLYFLACMGATIVVTHFVKSQQTAMFIVLLIFIVPSFFLAGLITPVSTDSLPSLLTSYALPSTHFVTISRVLFLKGLGLPYVAQPAFILLGMGLGAVLVGYSLFRKKIA